MDLPEDRPRSVTLAHALNFCRHGREVGVLTSEETFGHWIIWGHYACPDCRQVALDVTTHEPSEATIGGRNLPIRKR
jgi:hypothetical protein